MLMAVKGACDRISTAVSSWEGVLALPHRFGGTEFRLGRREIGHIHGDYQADIPFPKPIRDKLVKDHKADPHHILPQSGWITFRLSKLDDVEKGIELFR